MAKGKYQRWLEPEGLTLLEGWARDGLTDEQIAKKLRVSRKTLYEWIKKYSDIGDALKRGKEVVDYAVESALLKRALGYEVEETKEEDSDKDGHKSITTKRHIPADPTAAIFWLKNRRPDKWRDRRDGSGASQEEQAEAIEVFIKAVTPAAADLEALYAED